MHASWSEQEQEPRLCGTHPICMLRMADAELEQLSACEIVFVLLSQVCPLTCNALS